MSQEIQDTIRRIVKSLNSGQDGRPSFFLPAIQRDFVWNEDQIVRLFDSVMREYPIGTFLAWMTKSREARVRRFVDNYRGQLGDEIPASENVKHLVLDGQQRLQSFYIGLEGSYHQKELYFDVLSGEAAPPDDIRYGFDFRSEAGNPQWVKFKDLINSDVRHGRRMAKNIADTISSSLPESDREKIDDNVRRALDLFVVQDNIVCQVMDSVDRPDPYQSDDVVEVFIRANSGGTKLSRSDLMFSLLVSEWDDARERADELLVALNQPGYEFSRDFILKTCLTLLDLGAKYDVQKFRQDGVREKIVSEWENISNAIKCVRDFLHDGTFIRSDKAMASYLGLIPAIYFRYKHPRQWNDLKPEDFRTYIGRTLLARSFSGSPDSLIDAVNREIGRLEEFDISSIFQTIRDNGRSVDIPKNAILGSGYKDPQLHLVFNLWHPEVNYQPAYSGNLPQVDHIFPQSVMRENKIRAEEYHRIGNCMLLTAAENGAGGKGDKLPDEWFTDGRGNDEYLDKHLIPKNRDLWRVEKFADFLKERERMIAEKFRDMLVREGE